jgi:hypothetical protein
MSDLQSSLYACSAVCPAEWDVTVSAMHCLGWSMQMQARNLLKCVHGIALAVRPEWWVVGNTNPKVGKSRHSMTCSDWHERLDLPPYIAVFFLLVCYTTYLFFEVDQTAGLLMMPYVAWVAFANLLNISIVKKN